MITRGKSLSRVLFTTASFGSIHGTRSNPRSGPSASAFAGGGNSFTVGR